MKNLILIISLATLFTLLLASKHVVSSPIDQSGKDTILLWSSSELQELTATWIQEYSKINQNVRISSSPNWAEKEFQTEQTQAIIGFVSQEQLAQLDSKPAWSTAIARDVIVPIMNSNNPLKEEIYLKGLSAEDFATAYTSEGKMKWGSLLDNNQSKYANCYYIEDVSMLAGLSKFLQTDKNAIKATAVSDYEVLFKKIQNDKYAIGFCKLADIIKIEHQEIDKNLSFIPIDANGNDQIDYFENIYINSKAFTRGIWIGKYPRSLYSSIYAVANFQPKNQEELALLKWILTDGQQLLPSNGFSELISSERQPKIQNLFANQLNPMDVPYQTSLATTIIYFLLGGFVAFILLSLFLRRLKPKNQNKAQLNTSQNVVFGENSVHVPRGLFFDKSHTWAFMESDGFVRVGVDDFLQHITGPITKVKMKNNGEFIKKGEPFLTLIQYGKQLNILSPVSGTIIKYNTSLQSDSTIINSSPYSDGWIYLIESSNWLKEIKTFLMGDTYKAWLKNEFYRLKYFFSTTIKIKVTNDFQMVFQDGGEFIDHPLKNFGPEIWEEFQNSFYANKK